MTLIYDKKGKEYKVTHSVDVNGWLDAGYLLNKPVKKQIRTKTSEKQTDAGL